jgi:NAD-dependent dihydropyrimidine dehydrogenase PreA subunit
MILYFSATGNSKWVALRLAEATGDEVVNIQDCIREGRYAFRGEKIGIVTPTFFYGPPSILREFLQKADLQSDYIYYVSTYGSTPGGARRIAEKYLGKRIDAWYCIRMPDTWTVGFDLSTPEKVANFTITTEQDLDFVIGRVKALVKGDQLTAKIKAPALFVRIAYPMYEGARKTSHLSADGNCIGCGLCAKKCPVQAIEMQDKHPVWVKDRCVMCFGCLHRCPKFAIQYDGGAKTRKHGQYTHPEVKV